MRKMEFVFGQHEARQKTNRPFGADMLVECVVPNLQQAKKRELIDGIVDLLRHEYVMGVGDAILQCRQSLDELWNSEEHLRGLDGAFKPTYVATGAAHGGCADTKEER